MNCKKINIKSKNYKIPKIMLSNLKMNSLNSLRRPFKNKIKKIKQQNKFLKKSLKPNFVPTFPKPLV